MKYKPFSYDMDAIMGYSREQLDALLRSTEIEIIELLDQNKLLLDKIRALETDIRHYESRIKILETIKIEEKASKSVWKMIAAFIATIGAIFGALFFKKEE